jgi:hypothetical protein
VKQVGKLISNNYDIEESFKQIACRQHLEAIELANREATMAERLLLFKKSSGNKDNLSSPRYGEYSQTLKEFIRYVRYSAKPKIISEAKYRLFDSYLKNN